MVRGAAKRVDGAKATAVCASAARARTILRTEDCIVGTGELKIRRFSVLYVTQNNGKLLETYLFRFPFVMWHPSVSTENCTLRARRSVPL